MSIPSMAQVPRFWRVVGDTASVDKDALLRDEYVERITKVQEPFKLANRKMHPLDTIVKIGENVEVGGNKIVVMGRSVLGRRQGTNH